VALLGPRQVGKTTLAHALAESIDAQVISTDDVRAEMAARGDISGEPGMLGEGLYTPANIEAVYDAVLRRAQRELSEGRSVILDGTWRDEHSRLRARELAAAASADIVELVCAAALETTLGRISTRTSTTSQATTAIATALAGHDDAGWPEAHRIDTSSALAHAVAEAQSVVRPEQSLVHGSSR